MAALFKRYFLSEKPAGATISDLDFDLNPKSSIEKLKNHEFTRNEIIHYSTLIFFLTVTFFINPANFFIKILLTFAFILILLIPLTSQFFLNGLPIITWVLFFFTSTGIPATYRPPITVKVLPAMETVLYGDNLSDILAAKTSAVFDILAWIPYGLIHFGCPFFVAGFLFLWGPPTCVRGFAFAFGYMNLIGVIIQLVFPAAPPWYKILHGLDPANYSMLGSAGGLARIDTLLGIDLYTTNFSKNSPVVFGAFPSLHSGTATMEALFMSWLFPKLTPIFICYVLWLWWCTMYLTHHYFIDLMAGSFLSFVIFEYTKYKQLPINEKNAVNRWSYFNIRFHNIYQEDPLEIDFVNDIENNASFSSSQRRIVGDDVELNLLSRPKSVTESDAATAAAGDSSSSISPSLSVFENEQPSSTHSSRSISRSSNTSLESAFEMTVPPISTTSKSRID